MKPILFLDFDGTICHDRFWRGLEPAEYERIQSSLIVGNRPLMDAWLRGKHTAEEINRHVSESLGIPYEHLWEVFVRDAQTMYVPPGILEKLSALRSAYHTVLITVNMDSLERFTVPALKLDRYFDVIANSYGSGCFKYENGGKWYADIAAAYNVPIAGSVLIDDRGNNCEAFAALGGTAYRTRDTEHTLEILTELGSCAYKEFGAPDPMVEYADRCGAYGVAIKDDHVLIEKGKRGYFLPGGGIEAGETAEGALAREFLEETGYTITGWKKLGTGLEYKDSFKKVAHFYVVELGEKGTPTYPDGHMAPVEWLPIDAIRDAMYLDSQWWAIESALHRQ